MPDLSELPDRARQRLRTAAAAASLGGAAAVMLAATVARRLPKPVRDASSNLARSASIALSMVPGGQRVSATLHRLATPGGDADLGLAPHIPDAEPGPFADVLTGVDEEDLERFGLAEEAPGPSPNGYPAAAPAREAEPPARETTRAPEPEPGPGADLAHGELPLPDYDHLTLGQLRARLRRLTAEDLRLLRDYEQAHAHRLPVLTMFDNRLAKLDSGEAKPSGAAAAASGDDVARPPAPAGSSDVTPETSGPKQNPPSQGVPTNPAQPRT